ncbi:hypothetical protein BHE74_00040618 [Ensete ventricosum]|nr:hypothetical protein BHE74_00040618 [Ensete ventricosum]
MEQEASDGGSMASRPARQGFPVGLPSSLSRHASKEKNVKSVVYHLLLSDVRPHVRKSGLIKSNELVRHTVVLVMLLIEVRSDTLSIGADLRSWRVTQKSTWSYGGVGNGIEYKELRLTAYATNQVPRTTERKPHHLSFLKSFRFYPHVFAPFGFYYDAFTPPISSYYP